ncbi:MAG: YabP/YqfC family sporulation protein [bacterium]
MRDAVLESAAGVSVITLTGRGHVRVENHRGLVRCTPEEVAVNLGRVLLRLRGRALALIDLAEAELVVGGEITALEFME